MGDGTDLVDRMFVGLWIGLGCGAPALDSGGKSRDPRDTGDVSATDSGPTTSSDTGFYALTDPPPIALFHGAEGEEMIGKDGCLVDGDIPLVAVSGSGRDGRENGIVYLFEPPTEGYHGGDEAQAVLLGDETMDYFIWLGCPGDVDGDGIGDVSFGRTEFMDSRPHLVGGGVVSGATTGQQILDEGFLTLLGTQARTVGVYDMSGGDFDGDGVNDPVFSIDSFPDPDTGALQMATVIYTGGRTGSFQPSDADVVVLMGNTVMEGRAGGDLDGDGNEDLMGWCSSCDPYEQGYVYVLTGPLPAIGTFDDRTMEVVNEDGGEFWYMGGNLGPRVVDTDDDGVSEIWIGATEAEEDWSPAFDAVFGFDRLSSGTTVLGDAAWHMTLAVSGETRVSIGQLAIGSVRGAFDVVVGLSAFGWGDGTVGILGDPRTERFNPDQIIASRKEGHPIGDGLIVLPGDLNGDGVGEVIASESGYIGNGDYPVYPGAVFTFDGATVYPDE